MCTFTHVTLLQCNSNRWSGPDSKYILCASAKSSGLCGEILCNKAVLLSDAHLLWCSPSCSFSTLCLLIISQTIHLYYYHQENCVITLTAGTISSPSLLLSLKKILSHFRARSQLIHSSWFKNCCYSCFLLCTIRVCNLCEFFEVTEVKKYSSVA